MKKIFIVMQIVIVVLLLAKVASLFGTSKQAQPVTSFISTPALAQQTAPVPKPVKSSALSPTAPVLPIKENSEDSLSKERDLAAALLAKKDELDKRESNLRTEEQRLLTLRKEITDKIVLLKSQEEKMTAMLETTKTSEVKRYKEMAKVYEATPPAKAGKMLEQLDIKTAAGITMNMKKDKAGAIWGYIPPQKAVEITKEITRVSAKQQAE